MNNEDKNSVKETITAKLKDYQVQEGPAEGLIKEQDVDYAISEVLADILLDRIKTAEEAADITIHPDLHTCFSLIIDEVRDKVWTGDYTHSPGQSGKVISTPVTKSLRCRGNFEDSIVKGIQVLILQKYAPRTPSLVHSSNPIRYLEICKALFPNVICPHDAANGFRDFIENVHNACGTEGAAFVQKAFWLYSLKVGGTGKSHFIWMVKKAADELGIDCGHEYFKSSKWVSPTIGLHTITISEDTPKLDTASAETLNTIIDRSLYRYEIKYVQPGKTKSHTTLLMASNYVPFESNARRYNLVEYLQRNIVETLTDEERATYFPLWKKEGEGVKLIKEAFEVCPFKKEHAAWQPQTKSTDVGPRYRNTLILIVETVERFVPSPEFSSLDHMRLTEFSRLIAELFKGCAKDYSTQLEAFLTEMRACGRLRENKCEGKTPVRMMFFNWKKIAEEFSCGEAADGKSPLESTKDEWDNLITDEMKESL